MDYNREEFLAFWHIKNKGELCPAFKCFDKEKDISRKSIADLINSVKITDEVILEKYNWKSEFLEDDIVIDKVIHIYNSREKEIITSVVMAIGRAIQDSVNAPYYDANVIK